MKRTSWSTGLSVTGDGTGVVAHAGSVAVRLLADRTGLTGELSKALRRRSFVPVHDRGRVLVDVAVMLADGGEAIADIDVLRHQSSVLGAVASPPTVWRALDELTPVTLRRIETARARTRRHVWAQLDRLPASTVRRRRESPGRADHLRDREPDRVLHPAPPGRVLVGEPVQQVVGRAGTVGADQQLLTMSGRDLGDRLAEDVDVVGGGVRSGVSGTELDREHLLGVIAPHAERVVAEALLERGGSVFFLAVGGDQGRVDIEDHHLTEVGVGVGQLAFLEARHRAHARVEDRIRCAKDSGLGRFPSREFTINQAWTTLTAIAADLIAWLRLLALTGDTTGALAKAEPKTLRYRLLHVPARLTHGGRRRQLRIPESWPWTTAIVEAFTKIATIPSPG